MKPKFALIFVFVAFVFASCSEKDYYEGPANGADAVTDLVVPSDFDWKMVDDVTCNFTAETEAFVAVYTDASYSSKSLIAEYTLTPDLAALPLSVPNAASKLYLLVDGKRETVQITNGVAEFVAKDLTRSQVTRAKEKGSYFFYYPAQEEIYTAMFEDFFPIKGDYDFNDFVANYNYVIELSDVPNDKDPHVISIKFNLKVKALGGLYGYTPYVRVKGMKIAKGDEGFSCEGEGVEIVSEGNKHEGIIVKLDGYTKRPADAQYLNTVPTETKVATADLVPVSFTLTAKNSNGTGVKLSDIELDLYLKGAGHEGGNYEIHHRGIEPVDEACYCPGLGKDPYYCTDDNFVWAITVPADIPHATERTDFLKAYPKFADWVENSGKSNTTWYSAENRKAEHLFVMD